MADEQGVCVTIPSRSDPAVGYAVYWIAPLHPGNTCECPGFYHRGRCAHLTEAEEVLSEQ